MASKKKIIGSGVDVQTSAGVSALTVDETTGAAVVGPSGFTGAHMFNGAARMRAADYYNADPTIKLQTAIDTTGGLYADFESSGGTRVGSITRASASTIAFNVSSDYRLKKDVRKLDHAIERVMSLKPYYFKWVADNTDSDGFLAHELSEVIPEIVCGAKDAVDANGKIMPQGVDYSKLVTTLTAAIQEQQAMIEELKAEVALLKAK